MGSVVKTFFFDTDLEGWVLNGTGVTRSTEYGYPTIGCLKAYASGKNQTYTGGATWAGSYNDLGIPIGATVTGIDFRVAEEIPVCNNSGISWGFKYNAGTDLINTQNESVVRAITYRTITPITGLSIPSANSVDLAFLCTVNTGSNVSNTITAWFDGLMLTITYTEPIPEGSSQATIIITAQGSGQPVIPNSSTASVIVTTEGSESTVKFGESQASVVANGFGATTNSPMLGTGISADPFQVYTSKHLQSIGTGIYSFSSYYKQMGDVDWNDNANQYFEPIGYGPLGVVTSFTGTYDGNGKVITNLSISKPGDSFISLFCNLSANGILKNIGLINVSVTSDKEVGGLLGGNSGGTVSNCYVELGNIIATIERAGGLIGQNGTGAVVSNCYNKSVTIGGGNYIGGLIGTNFVAITNCYSTGVVTGSGTTGGLLGYNDAGIVNIDCFWDTETSTMSTSAGGTGMSTALMKTLSTFASWNISSIEAYTNELWFIYETKDYPKLGFQYRANAAQIIVTVSTDCQYTKIANGISEVNVISTAEGSGQSVASIQGSSEAQLFIVSEAAGIKLARAPPSEINVSILVEGSFIVIKTGSSQTSIIVSQDGYSEKIGIDGSEVTIGTSAEGSGSTARQGSSQTSVVVAPEGSESTIKLGESESQISVATNGFCVAVKIDGSESRVSVSPQGSGRRIANGYSEATSSNVSVQGSGVHVALRNSQVIVTTGVQGTGYAIKNGQSKCLVVSLGTGQGVKLTSGSALASVVITTRDTAQKVALGSSTTNISVLVQGNGERVIEVYSGGSEALLNVSTEASGLKKAESASESVISIDTIGTWEAFHEGSSDTSITVVSVGSGHNVLMPGVPVEIFLMPVDEVFRVVNDKTFIIPIETYIFVKLKEEYIFTVPKEDVFYAV